MPAIDPSGNTYWVNPQTGGISWSGPHGPIASVGTPATQPSSGGYSGWLPGITPGGVTYWSNPGTGGISWYPGDNPAVNAWVQGLGEALGIDGGIGAAAGIPSGPEGVISGLMGGLLGGTINYLRDHPFPSPKTSPCPPNK